MWKLLPFVAVHYLYYISIESCRNQKIRSATVKHFLQKSYGIDKCHFVTLVLCNNQLIPKSVNILSDIIDTSS